MSIAFPEKIKKFVLDALFPISCLVCGRKDIWICDKCLEKIEILPFQVCPYCEEIVTPLGGICPPCRATFLKNNQIIPLDNLIVSARYKENQLSRLVHLFKYNFVRDLSAPLAKIIIKASLKNNLALPDIIFPVPLHPRRCRWRGFNQAELLADYISQNLTPGFSIPVVSDLLIRRKYTRPQMKIKNYQQRKSNTRNAFAIGKNKKSEIIRGKKILLLDDICTTGSTLIECARILKQNGAQKVTGAVIARQEIK